MSKIPVLKVEEQIRTAQSAPLTEANAHRVQDLDHVMERGTRFLYEGFSRRSFLAKLGKLLLSAMGIQIIELLPVDRLVEVAEASNNNCGSWIYCNAYAPKLCKCCVGGQECTCPNGTCSGSQWWGCCQNWATGQWQWIQYTDCGTNTPDQVYCPNPCGCTPANTKSRYGDSNDPWRRHANWTGCANYYCTTVCVHTDLC